MDYEVLQLGLIQNLIYQKLLERKIKVLTLKTVRKERGDRTGQFYNFFNFSEGFKIVFFNYFLTKLTCNYSFFPR